LKSILVKLGGSLITDKTKPETPDIPTIKRLAEEIRAARLTGDLSVVLGNGGGSFPHRPANEYAVHKGVSGKETIRGIALVQDAAARLNRIVVKELINAGENAVSIQPSAGLIARNGRIEEWYLEPIKKALELGIIPVPYGDVVFDIEKGCCIVSTEDILSFIAEKLGASRIIIATNEDGVWQDFPQKTKLITEVNANNFSKIRQYLKGANTIDVTGGMLHKVERMLDVATRCGTEIMIINGTANGRLRDALLGKNVVGTVIRR